ncbi:S41 family peptidase [Marinoscillum pacificum]|uniref:S41 family peptidase n=1 Tax=Marinoscillum pacificum TaxID=392723 RepID=UPI0021585741|nr:S41 family peptidase [Marinoscillum pacificum]
MKNILKSTFLLSLGSLIFLFSCGKDEDPGTELDQINNWIYANMDFYYFWTDEIPSKPETNVDPANFFESLLSNKDRFSFIYDNYEELVNLLNGVSLESGFEFKLYLEESGSSNVIMQLSYIKANSPASDLNLKRGDIVYEINGTQLTTSNYQNLLSSLNSEYELTYRRFNFETEEFDDQGSVSLTPIVYSENPFLLDSVYDFDGKKVGYLVYNFYSPGSGGAYDDQMDAIFSNFKAAGIQDFILDLRFNSGGSETSVRNLTSLMVKNASSADLVFKKTYNPQVEEVILDDPDLGEDFLNVHFLDKSENIGSQLTSGTVYVLTSNRSASASEVTINSLKPFMDVYVVGDTTVGKDVGSITINDDENDANDWAIQPIVVKLVNNDGEDYPNGHYPDLVIEDNFLVLRPLGDVNEPLFGSALAAIGILPARVDFPQAEPIRQVYSSLDKKPWTGKFLLEENQILQE